MSTPVGPEYAITQHEIDTFVKCAEVLADTGNYVEEYPGDTSTREITMDKIEQLFLHREVRSLKRAADSMRSLNSRFVNWQAAVQALEDQIAKITPLLNERE